MERRVVGGFLSILGYTSLRVPWEDQAAAYRTLLDYAAAGKIKVDCEILPLGAGATTVLQAGVRAVCRSVLLTAPAATV